MTLRIERLDAGVLRLTLDRPQAANALSRAMQDALVAALASAATDDSVRAVLLAASGGRVFSAGADLREDLGLPLVEGKALRRALLMRSLFAVLDCPKPLITAVRGKAVGGGAMLALLADEAILATGASIGMPEIALGMPSPIGVSIIAARGGRGAAHRLMQANIPMDAEAALACGLVDAVADDVEAHALARAAALGALDPPTFAANKRWLNRALRLSLVEAAAEAESLHARGPSHAH